MSETKSTVLVKHHLKQLKLPTMHAAVREDGGSRRPREPRPPGLPARPLRAGAGGPGATSRRTAAQGGPKPSAGDTLPAAKTLDEFDFTARPSINKPLVLELAKGDWPSELKHASERTC